MNPTGRSPALGLLLAGVVSATCLAYRYTADPPEFTRWNLRSYDSHVYMAMAAEPSVFTVGPWGYRLLAPWLVHGLPPRWHPRGFVILGLGSLWLAGVLLFLFLRRLGFHPLAALASSAVFLLSAPAAVTVANPVMTDPLAVLLEVALLLALETGAGPWPLALLLALGVLTKELFLAFVPLVFLARRGRVGWPRALREAAWSGLPAVILHLTLRRFWTPGLSLPSPPWNAALLAAGWDALLASWPETMQGLLLGGLMPLALLGALRGRARPYLARYGYAIALTLAAALGAWLNVPGSSPKPFYGLTTLRLLLFTLPPLLPLALLALDGVVPLAGAAALPGRFAPRWERAAALAVAACLLIPFVALDRYRRVPLHERRNDRLTLALCTQSLRTAARLARGQGVEFEAARQRYDPEEDADWLGHLRWFLRDGWGENAPFGTGAIRMRRPQATLLVPCFLARDLDVELRLRSELPRRLAVRINGQRLAGLLVPAGAATVAVRLPGSALFRGDNLLALAVADGGEPGGISLDGLRLRYTAE